MRLRVAIAAMLLSSAAAASDGTTGASSLKLAVGARGLAMGEAFAAVADGSDALQWNPAGLILGPRRSVTAGFQPMAEDVSVSQAAGAARFGRIAAGVAYGAVTAADLEAYDDVGNRTGSFQAKDQTISAGAAWGGRRFSAGLTGRLWSSDIDGESASSAMADVGLAFENPFARSVRHGLVARHIGGKVSYVSQKDPLPLTLTFGTLIRVGRRVLLSGDYGNEKGAGGYFAAGFEWAAATTENFGLAVRAGYNTRRSDAGDLAGAAAGAGLSWRSVTIDYAWVPYGDIGHSQAVTLGFRFGEDAGARARAEMIQPLLGTYPAQAKSKIVPKKSTRRSPRTLESIQRR